MNFCSINFSFLFCFSSKSRSSDSLTFFLRFSSRVSDSIKDLSEFEFKSPSDIYFIFVIGLVFFLLSESKAETPLSPPGEIEFSGLPTFGKPVIAKRGYFEPFGGNTFMWDCKSERFSSIFRSAAFLRERKSLMIILKVIS